MNALEQTFDDFVNQHSGAAEESRVDWENRLEEWKKHLHLFYEKVEGFLSAYVKSGKIILKRKRVLLDEEHIGSYEAHALDILLGYMRITLMPVGTVLVTARGRIDMKGPKRTVRFLLVHEDAEEPEASGPELRQAEAAGGEADAYASGEYDENRETGDYDSAPYPVESEPDAPLDSVPAPEPVQSESDWLWIISTPPPSVSYMELAEESFKNALMQAVNG